MIVSEQSKSASFVTLVEIHNVDVSVASNRNATVLSLTAGTPQWSSAIVVDFEIDFDSGSGFPVPQLKRQANHQLLGCAQSSKFILFFVQY